jgi:hypothetical protein
MLRGLNDDKFINEEQRILFSKFLNIKIHMSVDQVEEIKENEETKISETYDQPGLYKEEEMIHLN